MIAYCIFMNDSIKAVVLDNTTYADKLLESKAKEYFDRNRHAFSNYGTYRNECCWHIHEIEVNES